MRNAMSGWDRLVVAGVLATLLGAATSAPGPVPASKAKAGKLVDLTSDFAQFFDATKSLSPDARVKAFHARYDAILPGYYQRDTAKDQAAFDGAIVRNLASFPDQRSKFALTAASFQAAFARGEAHFRKFFPDYRLTLPVYLVHSMGMQDGGTRTVAGRTIMFFGADVIARIHDDTTIGPFLDHELFHVYHGRFFHECDQLWCSLWEEGMATYAAAQMNPGSDDRHMMLTLPRPIRPEVEPRLKEAMCRLRAKFESTDQHDYGEFFLGQPNNGPFPPRYGYFLGYLIAAKIGQTMPLSQQAKLPAEQVKPLIMAAIDSYGTCAPAQAG